MKKIIFLDIDGVLLPWEYTNLGRLEDQTGWKDFANPFHFHMKVASPTLLHTFWNKFKDYCIWLTTWEVPPNNANKSFADHFILPHLEQSSHIVNFFSIYNSIERKDSIDSHYPGFTDWWKERIFAKHLQEIKDSGEEYRIVWIDDDMFPKVFEIYGSDPNIFLLKPEPCLTMEQIEEIEVFLNGAV